MKLVISEHILHRRAEKKRERLRAIQLKGRSSGHQRYDYLVLRTGRRFLGRWQVVAR